MTGLVRGAADCSLLNTAAAALGRCPPLLQQEVGHELPPRLLLPLPVEHRPPRLNEAALVQLERPAGRGRAVEQRQLGADDPVADLELRPGRVARAQPRPALVLRNLLDQALDLLGAGSLRAGAAGLIALLAGYRGYTAARAVKLEILTISWMSFSNFSALSPGVKW